LETSGDCNLVEYIMFKLSNSSKQRREGVDPRIIEISDLAIQISVVDFGHPADLGKQR
jgi:hypothetical protein